jgi:hypothetical protein
VCPNGHEASDGAASCTICGTAIAPPAPGRQGGDDTGAAATTIRRSWLIAAAVLVLGAATLIWISTRPSSQWDASVEHAIAYVCGDITPAEVAQAEQQPRPTVPGEFPSDVPAWEDYYEPEVQYRVEDRAFVAATRRGTYRGNNHAVAGWNVACVDDPGPLWVESPDGNTSSWNPRNGDVVESGEVDRYDLVKLHESGDLPESFDWQPPNE